MRRALTLLAVTALCACSSLRDQAVPACPYCGDPAMRRLADGTEGVVPRIRIASLAVRAGDDAEPPEASASDEPAARRVVLLPPH